MANQDLGLQPQRTLLSWQRTFFVAIVCALLIVRSTFQNESIFMHVMSYILLLNLLILWWVNPKIYAASVSSTTDRKKLGRMFLCFCCVLCLMSLLVFGRAVLELNAIANLASKHL